MKIAVLITGQMRDYKINAINQTKHLIEPNNADVFIYATTKNTIHSNGQSLEQKYYTTTSYTKDELENDTRVIYGENLKGLIIDEQENLPDQNFGTLGYFRTRMQNQIDNIGKGFIMAKEFAEKNNFKYDLIIRSRPDNAMYPKKVVITAKNLVLGEDIIYSTRFTPSGHRDLCFFALGTPEVFEKYCSYKYLEGEDANRTDSNFECTEHAWERWLIDSCSVRVRYINDICRPFTKFNKNNQVTDFPYRDRTQKLIDHKGNLVEQVEPETRWHSARN
tara:strand:- start:1757 stop:2587 length:831 start_codon:yes stop_codon:yes gene_type:complete